jgi:hypothetical protein
MNKIAEMEKNIRTAFSKIKEEMEDHLQAINENSSETQSVYDCIAELEEKLDKLNERIDSLHLMFRSLRPDYELSKKEKKVYLVINSIGEKCALSYADVSRKLNMNELEVRSCVASMIEKGIPILISEIENKTFFNIDKKFKDIQQRENILNIEEDVSKGMFETPLSQFV